MTQEQILVVMQQVFDSMKSSGMIDGDHQLGRESIILGVGSNLDSLGFVTFISDLEERISDVAGKEIYMILTDIHEFNKDHSVLSAATMAAYIESITQ